MGLAGCLVKKRSCFKTQIFVISAAWLVNQSVLGFVSMPDHQASPLTAGAQAGSDKKNLIEIAASALF